MTEVNFIIDSLERTPVILKSLLSQIPEDLFKIRRVENKWSIHEQVCHLVDAQSVLTERFRQFEMEVNPLIKSYTPPFERSLNYYKEMNMKVEIDKFPRLRSEMIKKLRGFDINYWSLEGEHEVFTPYNTRLLLTHTLNVDYAHIFSIEQLGLTKSEFEDEIMTIP